MRDTLRRIFVTPSEGSAMPKLSPEEIQTAGRKFAVVGAIGAALAVCALSLDLPEKTEPQEPRSTPAPLI